ncbi:hypothetical protein ACVBE9_05145 [Eionea flava]
MQAKRFIAADMRRALDMVKEEYGEDAMIISTERTAKGVELVATGDAALDQLQSTISAPASMVSPKQQKVENAAAGYSADFQSVSPHTMPQAEQFSARSPMPNPSFSAQNNIEPNDIGLASGKTKQQLADELEQANRKMQAAKQASSMTLETWADKEYAQQQARQASVQQNHAQLNTTQAVARETTENIDDENVSTVKNVHRKNNMSSERDYPSYDQDIRQLHDEIAEMRDTIEMQLLHMSHLQESNARQFNDINIDNKTENTSTQQSHHAPNGLKKIKTQLDFLALPKAANDKVLHALEQKTIPNAKPSLMWTHVLTQVARKIACDTTDPVSQGGIYAFLGTTGVGKTTTIAKLAARYVMENGADDVVLITTDQHRIAAHNQLTSLAKVLNVRVEIIDELTSLPHYLRQLEDYDLVLIDTPGMGHADPLLKPHLSVLAECEAVQNVLVIPANNQYQMMKASLHSYGVSNIDYCVMSKLDECATLSDATGILIEHDLPLAYITDGQSVPEDIAILKAGEFVSRAVNLLKTQRKNSIAEHSLSAQ